MEALARGFASYSLLELVLRLLRVGTWTTCVSPRTLREAQGVLFALQVEYSEGEGSFFIKTTELGNNPHRTSVAGPTHCLPGAHLTLVSRCSPGHIGCTPIPSGGSLSVLLHFFCHQVVKNIQLIIFVQKPGRT